MRISDYRRALDAANITESAPRRRWRRSDKGRRDRKIAYPHVLTRQVWNGSLYRWERVPV